MKSKDRRTNFALLAMFVVLTAVTTTIIRIPIPATTGYFNLGDIFIVASGLLLGPIAGAAAGIIGAGAADLYGYPQFILATVCVKGLEGAIVGILSRGENISNARAWLSAFSGAIVMVVGYFLFEAIIYPYLGKAMPFFAVTNLPDALVELVFNIVQGCVGALGGIGLWRALAVLRN